MDHTMTLPSLSLHYDGNDLGAIREDHPTDSNSSIVIPSNDKGNVDDAASTIVDSYWFCRTFEACYKTEQRIESLRIWSDSRGSISGIGAIYKGFPATDHRSLEAGDDDDNDDRAKAERRFSCDVHLANDEYICEIKFGKRLRYLTVITNMSLIIVVGDTVERSVFCPGRDLSKEIVALCHTRGTISYIYKASPLRETLQNVLLGEPERQDAQPAPIAPSLLGLDDDTFGLVTSFLSARANKSERMVRVEWTADIYPPMLCDSNHGTDNKWQTYLTK